jgi:hypothetical protein
MPGMWQQKCHGEVPKPNSRPLEVAQSAVLLCKITFFCKNSSFLLPYLRVSVVQLPK